MGGTTIEMSKEVRKRQRGIFLGKPCAIVIGITNKAFGGTSDSFLFLFYSSFEGSAVWGGRGFPCRNTRLQGYLLWGEGGSCWVFIFLFIILVTWEWCLRSFFRCFFVIWLKRVCIEYQLFIQPFIRQSLSAYLQPLFFF